MGNEFKMTSTTHVQSARCHVKVETDLFITSSNARNGPQSCLDKHILYPRASDVKRKLESGFFRANFAHSWQSRGGSGRDDSHVNKAQQRRNLPGSGGVGATPGRGLCVAIAVIAC
jgi:hypothetical protein